MKSFHPLRRGWPRQCTKTFSTARFQQLTRFSGLQRETGANLKNPIPGMPRLGDPFLTTTAESSPRPAAYSSSEITESNQWSTRLFGINFADLIRLVRCEYVIASPRFAWVIRMRFISRNSTCLTRVALNFTVESLLGLRIRLLISAFRDLAIATSLQLHVRWA
jgi:hypothetical protein